MIILRHARFFLSPTNNIAIVEVCQNANMYRVEVVQLTIKRSGGHHKKIKANATRDVG